LQQNKVGAIKFVVARPQNCSSCVSNYGCKPQFKTTNHNIFKIFTCSLFYFSWLSTTGSTN